MNVPPADGANTGRLWVLALLGAVLGAALFGSGAGAFPGLVLGTLAGVLLGRVLDLQAQLRLLDARVRALAERVAAPEPARQAPPRTMDAEVGTPAARVAAAPEQDAGPDPIDADVPPAPVSMAPSTPVPDSTAPASTAPPAPPAIAARTPVDEAFAPVRPPAGPASPPGAVERALSFVVAFFTTGNLVAKVGVLVLFVGVAFLVKYSIENALLPPALRLVGAGAVGMALLAVGFRLRGRTDAYGLLLQGAGIGVLYLTVFAAFRLYALIPGGAALVALVVIVVASSLLAVRQDSEAMAAWGLTGGFLAPVITSTGDGSHVALFSYYALLDLGILGMAWFRSWRWVNLLGFVFTFGISALWGASAYAPEHFAVVEGFLIWFFLHFVLVSLLFARGVSRAQAAEGDAGGTDAGPPPGGSTTAVSGAVNGTLVFGLPIAVFGLQSVLVQGMPFALAYTALGMAVVYLAALWVARRWHAVPALLGDTYLALTLVFASLAIPFAVADQRWTAAAWAVEGAGLVWLGLRQHSLFNRLFGLLLQLGGGVAFVHALFAGNHDGVTGFSLACALLALSGWAVSYLYARHASGATRQADSDADAEPQDAPALRAPPVVRAAGLVSGLAMLWAWPWWIGGVIAQVLEQATSGWQTPALLVLGGASAAAVTRLGTVLDWPAARRSGYAWLPALALLGLVAGLDMAPFGSMQAILAWLFAFGAAWSCLHSIAVPFGPEPDGLRSPAARWHAASLVVAVAIVTHLLYAQLAIDLAIDSGWLSAVPGVVAVLVLFALPPLRGRWPVRDFDFAYLDAAAATLLAWLGAWIVLGGWVSAAPDPLPYLPVGNPLELVQGAALLLAFGWLRERGFAWAPLPLAAVAFVLVNQVTLRILHAFAGVPFEFAAMSASALVQTTLSLLWTMLALGAMFAGARRLQRPVWIAGAALLGVVVLKLVAVDLSGIGTVARIVSFMGVGGLMLLIGYLAPLPPAATPDATPDARAQAPAARAAGADDVGRPA